MSLDPSKLSFQRQTTFIGVHQFSSMVPMLAVESSGAIGTNMEIGLSGDVGTATLEGGVGITAQRVLNGDTNPIRARCRTDPSNLILREMGSTGLSGIPFPTGAANAGPRHVMPIPSNWSRNHPIYVYVWWETGLGQQAASVTWRLLFELISLGSSVQWDSLPNDLLDTAIPAVSPVNVADGQYRTGPGIFAANRLKTSSTSGVTSLPRILSFALGTSAVSGWTTSEPWFYGIEFEYTPKFGRVRSVEAEAFEP
jgi:hypothetical protein